MAFYTYKCGHCSNEATVEKPIGKAPKQVRCPECFASAKRVIGANVSVAGKGWPIASDAMGVHPSQIAEAEAHDAKHGVPTEYVKEGEKIGNPLLRDPAHRRKYLKLHDRVDRNSYI